MVGGWRSGHNSLFFRSFSQVIDFVSESLGQTCVSLGKDIRALRGLGGTIVARSDKALVIPGH